MFKFAGATSFKTFLLLILGGNFLHHAPVALGFHENHQHNHRSDGHGDPSGYQQSRDLQDEDEAADNVRCRLPANLSPGAVRQAVDREKQFRQLRDLYKKSVSPKHHISTGCDFVITIPTYYHVIEPASYDIPPDSINVPPTDYMVRANHYVLRKVFLTTCFDFRIEGIDRVKSDEWYSHSYFDANGENPSPEEREMRSQLRVGGVEMMNVYINDGARNTACGYTPILDENTRGEGLALDGVLLNNLCMVGSNSDEFDEGFSLVHQVGHWLGLSHTNAKSCEGVGDGVADTPPSTYNGKDCSFYPPLDTCPNDGLPDALNNYMAWTKDECVDEFTQGQKNHMLSEWYWNRSDQTLFTQ